jgi:hypothetical protein
MGKPQTKKKKLDEMLLESTSNRGTERRLVQFIQAFRCVVMISCEDFLALS